VREFGIPSPYYELKVNHSSQCLAVGGASKAWGASVVQWPCTGGLEQQWFIYETVSGEYTLKNRNSQLCLAVGGASHDNGARVIQWDCTAGDEQQWRIFAIT
jgi:hypothetical protein